MVWQPPLRFRFAYYVLGHVLVEEDNRKVTMNASDIVLLLFPSTIPTIYGIVLGCPDVSDDAGTVQRHRV